MSAEQRGWYIQLLCHAWLSDPIATLSDDERKLKTLAGAGENWNTDKDVVLACFEREGGRLINRRLAAQHAELEAFRNERSESGRKGNEARWRKYRSASAQQSQSDRSDIANDRSSTATASASASSTSVRFSSDERSHSAETGQEDKNPTGLQSLVDIYDILSGTERDVEDPAYPEEFRRGEQRFAATGIDPDKLASLLLWAFKVSDFWLPKRGGFRSVEDFCRNAAKIETQYDNFYAKAAKKPHDVRDRGEVLQFLLEPKEEAATAPERIKNFEICDDCGGTPCTCKLCPNCHKPVDADGVCRRTFCLED
jgi:uncharacterized protein YdaU (DUF1376 family)